MSKEELLKYLIAEIDLIMHDFEGGYMKNKLIDLNNHQD